MYLSFELTMPNVGSWNGKWTGSDGKYFQHRFFRNNKITKEKITELLKGEDYRNFYHDFGDGWGANIRVGIVDAKTRDQQRKISSGFRGYDWMIDNIIDYGYTKDLNK